MDIQKLMGLKLYILNALINQNAEPNNDPAGPSLLAKVNEHAINNKIPENFPDIYDKILQAFVHIKGDNIVEFLNGLLKLIESKLK